MTWVLVGKLLRDARWPFLVVWLILFTFSAFWVKIAQRVTTEIAPFFNGIALGAKINPKLFEEVILKGPGKVSQAVLGGAQIRFENPNDFLAVEMLHPVVIILATLWAAGRAASAIAGELDRGTMELLLSQPVPRNRLLLAHLIVDAILLPVFCLSIVAGMQFGLWLVGPFTVDYTMLDEVKLPFNIPKGPPVLDVSATRQPWSALNLATMMFAFSGLSICISSLCGNRWKAVGLATLMGVIMFMINVIGQLWEPASWIRPFTIYYYYQPQEIWLNHHWLTENGMPMILILMLIGGIGYGLAFRVFGQRDLPAPL